MMTPIKRSFDKCISLSWASQDVVKDDLLILQPACKFQDLQIQAIIEDVLRTNLRGVYFSSYECESRCDALSQMIKQKLQVFEQHLDDVAVVVLMGRVYDTEIERASHKVWNQQHDSFASAWYKNDSLFAVGTVFASYASRNI